MQSRCKLKQIASFVLAVCVALTLMPAFAMAEEAENPDEGIIVEVIPEEPGMNESGETETADNPTTEPAGDPETLPAADPQETEGPSEGSVPPDHEAEPVVPEGESPDDDVPAAEETTETEPEATTETAEEPADNRHPLQEALDTYGHIYVLTVRKTGVYSSPVLKEDTLVFTTDDDMFPLLATKYTEHDTVVVWFLDVDGNVVKGFVSSRNLDEMYLLDEDAANSYDLPFGEGMTSIGLMKLFIVSGSYPITEETEPATEPDVETEAYTEAQDIPETTEPQETPEAAETPAGDVLFVEPDEEPAAGEEEPAAAVVTPGEQTEESGDESGSQEVEGESVEPPAEDPIVPAHEEGSYIGVTTKTRVFGSIDPTASETYYSSGYQGNFVKDATVQVQSVTVDDNGTVWYQVRYLYGDDFANGRMKWTKYGTAWVLESETWDAAGDSCTVTDYAYTTEYLRMIRGYGKRGINTTPMEGFTLKDIDVPIGSFQAFMSGLYGSSAPDDYPQIAASPSHGAIYATPHFLEGFTVYCLEHKLAGPGEESATGQTAKGPYVLVDMDAFVSDPAYGGTTGVRFKASTMHALGWVLRHTYPFMVLDRNDYYNETWSRVAGQFAMREVIKQLEGAQYVRDYWDMDNFYAFRAPEVYLTYARWLAENGIAHSRITGNITASNQSLIKSGSMYVGTVTLTTDADLIRIPRSAGTISGNSGGYNDSYYYVKSGDTIRITSSVSEFTVTMESISSDTEEANFLIGVPSVSIQKILVPLYGEPYPLKEGSLTFELSEGEILVTKKSTDGKLLEGAVFELLNSAGTVIATATTGENGTASFTGIQPGSYTVREKTPPQGYNLSVSASQDITVTAGEQAEATFINEPIRARVRIIKTDTLTERPLQGVVFTVTKLTGSGSGTVAAVITTDAQGVAETGPLPAGEYRIEETVVPEGYIDSGYTTTVWIQ